MQHSLSENSSIDDSSVPLIKGDNSIPQSLDDIILEPDELNKSRFTAAWGTLAAIAPGVNTLIDFLERKDEEAKKYKTARLMSLYAQKFASQDSALQQLKFLVGTPQGLILFRKLVQISDKGSDAPEYMSALAAVFKNLRADEVQKQFDKYEYLLSQIDRLSPQALILISKYDFWKNNNINGTTTSSGQTLSADWDIQLAGYFARSVTVTDSDIILRFQHSFRDLENAGMIVLTGHVVGLTPIGRDIYLLAS